MIFHIILRSFHSIFFKFFINFFFANCNKCEIRAFWRLILTYFWYQLAVDYWMFSTLSRENRSSTPITYRTLQLKGKIEVLYLCYRPVRVKIYPCSNVNQSLSFVVFHDDGIVCIWMEYLYIQCACSYFGSIFY